MKSVAINERKNEMKEMQTKKKMPQNLRCSSKLKRISQSNCIIKLSWNNKNAFRKEPNESTYNISLLFFLNENRIELL